MDRLIKALASSLDYKNIFSIISVAVQKIKFQTQAQILFHVLEPLIE